MPQCPPRVPAARAPSTARPSAVVLAACALALLVVAGCSDLKRWAYAPSDRDEWQQPQKVVEALEIRPGEHIADLGAGGGYFTYALAEATGPAGRVYAIDVDPDMTGYLEQHSREIGVDNVEVVLAEPTALSIPDGSVDLIFTCNTYHHLEDRVGYFRRASEALRPGGRLAVVEYDEAPGFHMLPSHATEKAVIRRELEEAGFQLLQDHDFLERQSFQVFTPVAAGAE